MLRNRHLASAASFLLVVVLTPALSSACGRPGRWSGWYGSLTLVAPGDRAPKEIGGVLVPLAEPVCLNAQGDVFFNAKVEENGVEIGRGVFRASRDGVATVILSGDPAPTGGIFLTARASGMRFCNDLGAIAFEGMVADASHGEFGAVYVTSAGGVTEVARRGDPVPGAAANLLEPIAPSINDAGEVVFGSSVASADSGAVRQGIFFASTTNLSIVAIEGAPIPGIEGGFYDALRLRAELNEGGEVAFQSDVSGVAPPFSAIFVWVRDHVRVAARSTDEDPLSTQRYEVLVDFSLNDHGDVAFGARLEQFDNLLWSRFGTFPRLVTDSDGVDVPALFGGVGFDPGFRIGNRDQFALIYHIRGDFRSRVRRNVLFVSADGTIFRVVNGTIDSNSLEPLPFLSLNDAGTIAYLANDSVFSLDCSTSFSGRPAGCGVFLTVPLPDQIEIDVKPGDTQNAIPLRGRGIIPVAVLGAKDFNVENLDVATMRFGPRFARPVHRSGGHREDVNGDGFVDLISHYRTSETGLAVGATEANLRVRIGQASFVACDAVQIIGR